MKIAILGDIHAGARQDHQVLSSHLEKFFTETFFPYLVKNKIKHIIQVGDIFDRRKYTNHKTLDHFYDYFVQPLIDNNIEMTTLLGNHDTHYKSTNFPNSPSLFFRGIKQITVVENEPLVKKYGKKELALVPWICPENRDVCLDFINTTDVDTIFGHFEINGFDVVKGIKYDNGLKPEIFGRFKNVFSGHFHIRQTTQNIHYVGTPYQITFGDYGNDKGFHILQTTRDEFKFVENPENLFEKIFYHESKIDLSTFNYDFYKGKFIKVEVYEKADLTKFNQFVDSLNSVGPARLQIIEDSSIVLNDDDMDSVNISEDTPTMISGFIDSLETDLDKKKLKTMVQQVYLEALRIHD